ncbi:MAG: hypothetical protein HY817_04125 [Candidatus Abawacabacteria bacterium]|nr:hypothetical protein [Candidatus Abawacabacteria bacterium]
MKVGLLCGGPSLERGISLNSARSILDHLSAKDIEIMPFYFDHKKNAYQISCAQLYSNTPSDFDFKLHHTAKALSEKELVKSLQNVDIVFPAIHGAFGEDGTIQRFLEKHHIPFVGTESDVCRRVFDKYIANEFIAAQGFFTLPSIVLKIFHKDHKRLLQDFFAKYKIKRAVVKPASGGSSIGVFSVNTVEEALEKAEGIFSKRMDTRVVIEPFATGNEFTVIILQNRFGLPVAVLPTEIETDYTEHQIFDFRKKYLPTRQVTYHCPPRFSQDMIEKIQVQAEQLFSLFGMRDFARFDGWVMDDGNIWFSDFNPISGMEQNSFLFQQSSRIGLSHKGVLRHIVKHACARYQIAFPQKSHQVSKKKRKLIHVLFGGQTSERQVSLMSGTNVWLKLRESQRYQPSPFLLDTENHVWQLPYAFSLNHTVEEIQANCENAAVNQERLLTLEKKVQMRLASDEVDLDIHELPKRLTLDQFIAQAPFVFLALHGGMGEDGTLQSVLTMIGTSYNGSDKKVSALCMDKWATGELVKKLAIPGVQTAEKKVMAVADLLNLRVKQCKQLWKKLGQELKSKTLIVKPRSDGCSSGIVHLYSAEELYCYLELIRIGANAIPKHTFKNQTDIIELPSATMTDLLFEQFIETDMIRVKGNELKYQKRSGWMEITVGVVGKKGKLAVLNPSITVAEGEVLSVEEKFQGGTGINITPPPANIIKVSVLQKTKDLIKKLANKIGIAGYARLDAFMEVKTGNIILIEVNSLPGLTPSTVFYQQALAEKRPLFPRLLLEEFVNNKGY